MRTREQSFLQWLRIARVFLGLYFFRVLYQDRVTLTEFHLSKHVCTAFIHESQEEGKCYSNQDCEASPVYPKYFSPLPLKDVVTFKSDHDSLNNDKQLKQSFHLWPSLHKDFDQIYLVDYSKGVFTVEEPFDKRECSSQRIVKDSME